MAYSLTKGYQLAEEGLNNATICGVEVLEDQIVKVKGKNKKSDIIQVDYQTDSGKARGRYFPLLTEESALGQLVIAINGVIPNKIEDIEEFLMDEELIIEVKHNKSKETNRVFANAVNAYPLDDEEEEDDDDLDLYTDDQPEEDNFNDDLDSDLPFQDNFEPDDMDWVDEE